MEDTLLDFQKRQEALYRKHARLAKGYTTRLDKKSGTIVHVPDSKMGAYGLKTLLFLLPGFLVFKAFVLAWLGSETYLSHVQELATGSSYEQAGAWLMQVDPITAKLAALMSSLMG
jgi:hypothetical protein